MIIGEYLYSKYTSLMHQYSMVAPHLWRESLIGDGCKVSQGDKAIGRVVGNG